jgi:hypothetical protein
LALGEVYHKAWHVSGGEFRRMIENDCIQVGNIATLLSSFVVFLKINALQCSEDKASLLSGFVVPLSCGAPLLIHTTFALPWCPLCQEGKLYSN